MAVVKPLKPDLKCLKKRGFAHFWRLGKPVPEDMYVEAKCDHCKKERLFRLHMPSTMNWKRVRASRKREERKRRKAGTLK